MMIKRMMKVIIIFLCIQTLAVKALRSDWDKDLSDEELAGWIDKYVQELGLQEITEKDLSEEKMKEIAKFSFSEKDKKDLERYYTQWPKPQKPSFLQLYQRVFAQIAREALKSEKNYYLYLCYTYLSWFNDRPEGLLFMSLFIIIRDKIQFLSLLNSVNPFFFIRSLSKVNDKDAFLIFYPENEKLFEKAHRDVLDEGAFFKYYNEATDKKSFLRTYKESVFKKMWYATTTILKEHWMAFSAIYLGTWALTNYIFKKLELQPKIEAV